MKKKNHKTKSSHLQMNSPKKKLFLGFNPSYFYISIGMAFFYIFSAFFLRRKLATALLLFLESKNGETKLGEDFSLETFSE